MSASTLNHVIERGRQPGVINIKWGAIIAGVIIALSLELVLNFLGVGIGLISFKVPDDLAKVGSGTLIWLAISGIISMFCAGWVTGRLSCSTQKYILALHAVLVWGFAILLTFLVTTSTGTVLLGGATNIVKASIDTLGQQSIVKAEGQVRENADLNPYSPPPGFGEDVTTQEVAEKTMDKIGKVSTCVFISFFLSVLAGIFGATLGKVKLPDSV